MAKQNVSPVVRVAPLGELRAYIVSESELDELERGSPASLHLNFALFFWGVSLSLLVTLLATKIESIRVFAVFVIFFAVTLICAVVFSIFWNRERKSSQDVISRIKNRMPPPLGIQELTPTTQTQSSNILPG